MSEHICSHCGKKAVVKEQDVFYSCAQCWVKDHTKKKVKKHEQDSLH